MSKFNHFETELKQQLETYAATIWKDYKSSTLKEANEFALNTREDLKRWSIALARGQLTRDDFAWLVESKRDLFHLETLKQAGLSKVAIGRFINGVIDLVVTTALKTL